jgi:hypothetical protein
MRPFTAQAFTPFLGQTFYFHPSSERAAEMAELELIDVKAGTSDQLMLGHRQPFSVLFKLRGQGVLRRGLQHLQHPDMDACDLFLARVHVPESHPGAVYYEAVFG